MCVSACRTQRNKENTDTRFCKCLKTAWFVVNYFTTTKKKELWDKLTGYDGDWCRLVFIILPSDLIITTGRVDDGWRGVAAAARLALFTSGAQLPLIFRACLPMEGRGCVLLVCMQMQHPPNYCIEVGVTYGARATKMKFPLATGGQMGHIENEYYVVKAGVTYGSKHKTHCENMPSSSLHTHT